MLADVLISTGSVWRLADVVRFKEKDKKAKVEIEVENDYGYVEIIENDWFEDCV